MGSMHMVRGCVAALVLIVTLNGQASANDFDVELVYLGGHTVVPGEIETFNSPVITWASINSAKQVSSLGSWTPDGAQFGNLGMFKWDNGVLSDLLKGSDLVNAPGFAQPVSSVQNGLISDTGNVLFEFSVGAEGAIASGPNRAGLTTIDRTDVGLAPGTNFAFQFFNNLAHNGDRFATYGNAGGFGVWTGDEAFGTIYRLAQENQTLLPGTADPIDDMIFAEPVINNTGYAAVEVGWDAGKSAIVAGNPAAAIPLFTIAKTGDPTPGGGTFQSLGRPRLNNPGTLAFTAGVDLGGQTESGLFRTDGTVVEVAIDTVTPVPGEGGMTFDNVSSIALAGDDNLYFGGTWDNNDQNGLFVHHPDTGITALLKKGDPAPETGSTFNSFSNIHANAVGDYIFLASLADGRTGLFATENGGATLAPLFFEGQPLDATGLGDFATVTDLILPFSSGGQDGLGMWLNDAGEILLEIEFLPNRDLPRVSSGLYVVTIPEPTTLGLLALGATALLRRRSRRP